MRRIAATAVVAGVSLAAAGCGKKGPLIYPDMLVPAAPAVSAMQSGAAVKLQVTLPSKDRGGKPVSGVAGVTISRRASGAVDRDVCRSCTTDYMQFRTIYLEPLPTDVQRFGSLLVLRDNDVSIGAIYSYRAVPFTPDRVDGVMSLPVEARVDVPLAAPGLTLEAFPTELRLHLSTTFKPGSLVGYNIYRSAGTAPRMNVPLNREPFKGDEFVDSALERRVTYRYTARAVVMREQGGLAESTESREVEGMLKDDD